MSVGELRRRGPLATKNKTQLPPVTEAWPREAAALDPLLVLGTSSCGSAQRTSTQGQTQRSQVAGTPADHPNPDLLREGPSPSPLLPTPAGLPGHGLHPGYGVQLGPWTEGWGWGTGSQVAPVGGGAPCAPACNPHYGPGTQCQQSPGAKGTEHPPGHELVPPALHSGTCWVMVAHGVGLARPQHCIQLPAGSPCPPPCLAPGKTLLTCASADLLLWWREGATRGM